MASVFWDTNLFIYLFERNPQFSARVVEIRKNMLARGDRLVTSSLTVGEILVKPAREDNRALVNRYRAFFEHPALTVVPFDYKAACIYAEVRKDRGISRPDAVQLACAAAADVDLFITNDERLSSARVTGVKFVTSLARAPL
jgi:predicted nucleic acid-binding protein